MRGMPIVANRGRETGRRLKADHDEVRVQLLDTVDGLVMLAGRLDAAIRRGDDTAVQVLAVQVRDHGLTLLSLATP